MELGISPSLKFVLHNVYLYRRAIFLLYHFDCTVWCSFYSDIDISKQQMPKKIAEVAKEATILDYEVTPFYGL